MASSPLIYIKRPDETFRPAHNVYHVIVLIFQDVEMGDTLSQSRQSAFASAADISSVDSVSY